MIKEATVKLDGLTVIAGENDTTAFARSKKILHYEIKFFQDRFWEYFPHNPLLTLEA